MDVYPPIKQLDTRLREALEALHLERRLETVQKRAK
jgi:hypothetical protein